MTKKTNTIDTGFPVDYNWPTKSADFFKLEPWENELRVLAEVVVGYEYWTAKNKPVRQKTRFDSTPWIKTNKDWSPTYPKEVWALKIYDYKTKSVALWAIPQAWIKDDLWAYGNNSKLWGLGAMDITVTKTGSWKETKYTLTPIQTLLTDEVKKASKEIEIDLEAYFDSPYEEEVNEVGDVKYSPEAPFPDEVFEK